MIENDPDLIDQIELARRFGVTPRTIRRWHARRLPVVRVGRHVVYRLSAVGAWLERQQQKKGGYHAWPS